MKKKYFLLCILIFSFVNSFSQIKGVWVTNVASDALLSRDKIKECVSICKASGFTDIFMVVYNNATTMYPSKVMDSLFGIKIDKKYGERDPLKEMIAEAHRHKIRVHAWFEFGFSSSYDANGGKIVQKFPHWAAINVEGKLVTKNKFDWLNAFHPEVQAFMKSLLLEVVKNYAVDGIQGDDRLPANPSTAGYDAYTLNLYQQQHNGQQPPANYKDSAWVQWRANLLTDFLVGLYKEVKAIKPDVLVTMAPSIYPWSKEEYLQDWPAWVQKGVVDYIFPQVYRYNFKAYQAALSELSTQLNPEQKKTCFPGILQSLGNGYLAKDSLLQAMVTENRKQGFNGEVFFYFDGVKKNKKWFAKIYPSIKYQPINDATFIDARTKSMIKEVLKEFTTVQLSYKADKAILTGFCTDFEKMKLIQIFADRKVKTDFSQLKLKP